MITRIYVHCCIVNMTCITYETHQGECRFSVMVIRDGFCSVKTEFSHSVGGVDDLSYFDYVFGVVNGVYDLKYYCMVI